MEAYSLVFIVKIGRMNQENSNSTIFGSKMSILDHWRSEPGLFCFYPAYLSVFPLFNPENAGLISDGKHLPKMLVYNQTALMFMIKQSYEFKKLQIYNFQHSQSEELVIETQLVSNRHSNINVLNFLFRLEKPKKLSLQNTDRMLSQLRKLFESNPVILLIHHKQILDRVFSILALEYDFKEESEAGTQTELNKLYQDEDRQDVAFEILLLMIDLFHGNFPEYLSLLNAYFEEHFFQPKVFVALTAQLRLVGNVFSQDISNAERFWLT